MQVGLDTVQIGASALHRQSVGSPVREGGEEYGHILTISEHMVD